MVDTKKYPYNITPTPLFPLENYISKGINGYHIKVNKITFFLLSTYITSISGEYAC